MSSSQKPIDVGALLASLQKKASAPRSRGKKKEVDTTLRTFTIWFKLDRVNGECTNPDCQDPRRGTEKAKNIRVATVREKVMCMYCFTAGYGGGYADA